MNKQEFLAQLEKALSGLPKEDIEERLTFYREMIDDRMEEGLSEEAAVADIGIVEEIASQIIEDTPIVRLVREKVSPKRRLRAWEIVLLVISSPIWLSLLIAALAIALAVYIVVWAVILALWAIDVSFIAGAFGGIVMGIIQIVNGNGMQGLAFIGAGILCAGLAIFMFFLCKAAAKGAVILTKKITRGIKNLFIRREKQKGEL